MAQVSIKDDFCYEGWDSLDEGLDWIRTQGVEPKVLIEEGPGGGWPFIEMTGEREAVVKLMKESWSASDSELEGRLIPV